MMMSDVDLAYKAINEKRSLYDTLWAYYDGKQPLRYSTQRLKEVFQNITARFTQNWCAVVVDSVAERMDLEQFLILSDEEGTRRLNDWWAGSGMEVDEDDVHLCALVTGEAFVIVWPNEEGELEAYYNDSRLCHVEYEKENPRQMRFGAKCWQDDDDYLRLTLYYADRLEYWRTTSAVSGTLPAEGVRFEPYGAFAAGDVETTPVYIVENPFNAIPVFHFRREQRAIKSA